MTLRAAIPEYHIWASMKDRCNNPNSQVYERYGKKGIKVCDEWNAPNAFDTFIKDVGSRPTPQHSLDRIDPSGNYEPSNCRWATKTQQSLNQRMRRNNTSGYRGISKNYKKWTPYISFDGMTYPFGSYNTPEEAAYIRDQVVLQLHGNDAITNYIY